MDIQDIINMSKNTTYSLFLKSCTNYRNNYITIKHFGKEVCIIGHKKR